MQLTTNTPSVIVIDNFYQDPHAVRQIAMNSDYHPPGMVGENTVNHSGRLSLRNYHPTGLSQYVSRLVGEQVRANPKFKHGYFRYELPGDLPNTMVHIDAETNREGRETIDYSLVIYLTESAPDPKNNGTLFFKHKKGFIKASTIESYLLKKEDLDDPSQWEVDSRVSYQWNRAVLFDSKLFHAPGVSFGTDKADARCVQVFYFCKFDQ